MFGKIIFQVFRARFPEDMKTVLFDLILILIKVHIYIDFEMFWRTVLFTMPFEVELSVFMGVAGCGWPISRRAVWIGHDSLSFVKKDSNFCFCI